MRPTLDDVRPAASVDEVVPDAGRDVLGASASPDDVVAPAGADGIAAPLSKDPVAKSGLPASALVAAHDEIVTLRLTEAVAGETSPHDVVAREANMMSGPLVPTKPVR